MLVVIRDSTLREWASTIRKWCGPMDVHANDGFAEGELKVQKYGKIRFSTISAHPHVVSRAHLGAVDEEYSLYFFMPIRGCLSIRTHVEVDLQPRDLIAIDMNSPFRISVREDTSFMAVRVPHAIVGLTHHRVAAVAGQVWSGQGGLGALVAQTLEAISLNIDAPGEVAAESMGLTVGGLLTALCTDHLALSVPASDSDRHNQVVRMQAYIRSNLHDPTLSVATVAKTFRVSVRHVQQLFAEQGASPARWIRSERLERSRVDLLNRAWDHLTVAAIGERWGFYGASHFTRIYREHFGQLPSETRAGRSAGVASTLRLDHEGPGSK